MKSYSNTLQTEEFLLKSGLTVKVRTIRPDDAPRLRALFHRLSPQSIFLRVLQYKKDLTPEEAGCLAKWNSRNRMAFVATFEQEGEEILIGVARYAVIGSDQKDMAEVGVVVEDAYQNQGLGSYLLDRLTRYARHQGICTFVGTVSFLNAPILRFIKRSGLPVERKVDSGAWEIQVDLQ